MHNAFCGDSSTVPPPTRHLPDLLISLHLITGLRMPACKNALEWYMVDTFVSLTFLTVRCIQAFWHCSTVMPQGTCPISQLDMGWKMPACKTEPD